MTTWADRDAKRDRLQALAKTKPEAMRRLQRRLDFELTYSSLALSGNSLTREEMARVLGYEDILECQPPK